jgi:hypothetical protein
MRGAGGRWEASRVGGRPVAQLEGDAKHEHGRASSGAGRRASEVGTTDLSPDRLPNGKRFPKQIPHIDRLK